MSSAEMGWKLCEGSLKLLESLRSRLKYIFVISSCISSTVVMSGDLNGLPSSSSQRVEEPGFPVRTDGENRLAAVVVVVLGARVADNGSVDPE